MDKELKFINAVVLKDRVIIKSDTRRNTMNDNKVTIERMMPGEDSTITLYKLSNGEIVNVDEAVNYVRQGRLKGVVIMRDEEGRHHIKPTGHTYNELK